ncbi:putative origin recognition complex subunit 1 (ORC1) putativecell division cycle 6 (CDC6) [Leptomonas pyrrhocoris]|uniref:Origin recognition complex subunit 1 n=1 Tax=Leptomonas pyrrhocoris TaxID=157538 RepID=A0A0N0VHF0_LEPPY|nr:putative origin recognition complex subunit 1 (ORC1) putativecell division cycle 6 (CDC6) [Leptomonas pyrrhocoris]XP_015664021.1 putative origin recognition complex subunit 1 (ORC1) putativecell division cycle 6 (CDC6) [Leptomonas pyrrhocoris]KPA85581.1 putative origin recognition complex subunit 1 (ORC1) putativecell division cycle 6 (CDC6) [Leptomonas pyrrhocoris]KPA85582.1 putative origin recognition complex subunit 1 (ORC1) putativecell division cycle 6 (CDC6) [Leptomonas pyrrhocoris]|eukprot:XP_015664020.1 putative origin recognition complex subunit 1 (ORC1) putativecell division cycle 6 (CDC6) [Leptomonas pyrrhocoris]
MKRERQADQQEAAVAALRKGAQALSVSSSISTKDLVCREAHAKAIQNFLEDGKHHTMQIFGMPGTGKTATVNYVLAQLAAKHGTKPTAVFLNGFVVQKSSDIYYTLNHHLTKARLGTVEQCPAAQCASNIEKHFRHGWGNKPLSLCVIIIDEVDKILEKHAKGLFKVVDWLTLPYANCKLITISNSMDLQLDAKTKSRLGVVNQLVFSSYGMHELRQILLHRVGGIVPKLFADQALNQLCTQTASHYGDVRRLLQSASAAICSVLMKIQDDAVDLSSVDGIVSLREIHAVVRQIFHDRFVEFITTLRKPVLFITVAVLGKETEELFKRREVDCRLAVEQVLLITQQAQRKCMGVTTAITRVAFLAEIELLRQVSLIDVSMGEDRIPVHSADGLLESTEDVYVSLLQPYQMVVDACRLHDTFGATYGAALHL